MFLMGKYVHVMCKDTARSYFSGYCSLVVVPC